MCQPPRLHHGNIGLHHGDDGRACFVPGVWGPYYSGMVLDSGSTRAVSPQPARPSIISSDLIRRITRPSPGQAAGMEILDFSSAHCLAFKKPG